MSLSFCVSPCSSHAFSYSISDFLRVLSFFCLPRTSPHPTLTESLATFATQNISSGNFCQRPEPAHQTPHQHNKHNNTTSPKKRKIESRQVHHCPHTPNQISERGYTKQCIHAHQTKYSMRKRPESDHSCR
ncbi:hypothetical protein P153DRAFT_116017 [Dothidotthia symphoricarpi CBS 119687]|uniref:Uncharacterized protein n=1 Tax=Dothidotthia symphoricarpi CBS 119687 TaxID=1392245 RepID=A0A6A6A4R7_9PLEO|nr:uncharacterized protein P153DRAFT_116017 [Dothidotthia symphoricarpi CBS 119687]KAF2125591.1 hypothetical protein P153DRAFT_116017 [Dothidotthia symphoricarpi CBS 119687]